MFEYEVSLSLVVEKLIDSDDSKLVIWSLWILCSCVSQDRTFERGGGTHSFVLIFSIG